MNTTLKARLVLLAFALLTSVSVARAQGGASKPITSLSVVDSKSKTVGEILGFNPGLLPVVAIRTGGALIQLGVRPSGFVPASVFPTSSSSFPNGSVIAGIADYESTNCSGTPYSESLSTVKGLSDNLFTVVDLLGTVVLAVDGSLPPKFITAQSFLEPVGGCHLYQNGQGDPQPISFTVALLPVKMLVDLSTLYTAPFTVK